MGNYMNFGFVMLSRKPLTGVTSCPHPLPFPACFVCSCFYVLNGWAELVSRSEQVVSCYS